MNTCGIQYFFYPKGKPLLVDKGTKSVNLLHSLLILVIPQSTAPSLAPILSPKY